VIRYEILYRVLFTLFELKLLNCSFAVFIDGSGVLYASVNNGAEIPIGKGLI